VPRNGCYPHFEPICGYLGLPTHAKYRSVKTAVATHVELVVPPPLVRAWAGRPPRALVYPVPCLSRRRIILHRASCLFQPAPWPPPLPSPPPPPPPALNCGRTLHSELALCPLHPIFIDRCQPCRMVGRGELPEGGGDGSWGGGQLGGVARTEVAAVCRCGRFGELKSSRPVFGHLPTLNVGKMWVYPTWVGDPHFTHIWYPRPTCRRSLMSGIDCRGVTCNPSSSWQGDHGESERPLSKQTRSRPIACRPANMVQEWDVWLAQVLERSSGFLCPTCTQYCTLPNFAGPEQEEEQEQ